MRGRWAKLLYMLYYWKINIKCWIGFLLTSLILFVISLFHLKSSSQTLLDQLVYNFLVSFGILMVLYLILFFASFYKFRRLGAIFSEFPFNNLPKQFYNVHETKPHLLFLVSLTIKGSSKNYPVRIEY